jgi:hypothetical protein
MNARLIDNVKTVMGCPPAALTSTAGDGDYVSLKNFSKLRIAISVLNGTSVTGGTVTLKQATAVAGTNEKPLAFSKMLANTDCAAGDTPTETAVISNTFTTGTTNSKQLLYVIEVDASDLDASNGFNCVRVDITGMTNAVGSVIYDLYGSRYYSPIALPATTD